VSTPLFSASGDRLEKKGNLCLTIPAAPELCLLKGKRVLQNLAFGSVWGWVEPSSKGGSVPVQGDFCKIKGEGGEGVGEKRRCIQREKMGDWRKKEKKNSLWYGVRRREGGGQSEKRRKRLVFPAKMQKKNSSELQPNYRKGFTIIKFAENKSCSENCMGTEKQKKPMRGGTHEPRKRKKENLLQCKTGSNLGLRVRGAPGKYPHYEFGETRPWRKKSW